MLGTPKRSVFMVKNTFKFLGIIVLVALIGFSMTACDLPDDDIVLNWTAGNLPTAASEAWYTFSVTSGTTYYIWVKEYWSNSVVVADGYADVRVDVRYESQTGTLAVTNSDSGANNTPAQFTALQSGIVHLRVSVCQILPFTGHYKVAVTTNNTRPSGE
jgi:hypothetical protein